MSETDNRTTRGMQLINDMSSLATVGEVRELRRQLAEARRVARIYRKLQEIPADGEASDALMHQMLWASETMKKWEDE